mmetsp:Transcript_25433/g.52939  ORF Transcript_25433/g.52939 Transcript_25433/m.52939 type:complete len:129 (-) Transcript_25433:60-446(-)
MALPNSRITTAKESGMVDAGADPTDSLQVQCFAQPEDNRISISFHSCSSPSSYNHIIHILRPKKSNHVSILKSLISNIGEIPAQVSSPNYIHTCSVYQRKESTHFTFQQEQASITFQQAFSALRHFIH